MATCTLTDLLVFSAGAILVNYIYIYIHRIYKEFELYEFGRWRQPLPWLFLAMEKMNEDPESVRLWC